MQSSTPFKHTPLALGVNDTRPEGLGRFLTLIFHDNNMLYVAVRERVDEPDQKRNDQLQEVHLPEEQPGQVLQPLFQGRRRQRVGVLRVLASRPDEPRDRPVQLLRLITNRAPNHTKKPTHVICSTRVGAEHPPPPQNTQNAQRSSADTFDTNCRRR